MSDLAAPHRPGDLPAETTRFVGRQRDLTRTTSALEETRLVTLCGVGGVGKTRLAVRAAAELQHTVPDGVWLAELSALHEPGHLAAAVAGALQLPDQAAGDPLDLLTEQLAGRELLLILDTCEHLIGACALLVEVLLRAVPGLRVLATSREPLGVPGERVVDVAPMPTPADTADAADIAGCESVVLFTERARSIVPGFAPAGDDLATVARLCRRLDGIPLAIELAAVRLRTLSVGQLIDRLDDRFQLLAADGQDATGDGRHRTLRAAVEWSHDLCTPDEQRLWAQLSIFPGGFDLAAAEAVCADPAAPAHSLVDLLGRLVEKSIVIFEHSGSRYRMLDTIREYGWERLDRSGERATRTRLHRDHFLTLAVEARDGELTPRQLALLDRLRADNHNLRFALDFSLGTPGEQAAGLRLAEALFLHWLSGGMLNEGLRWLDRALAATPAEPGAASPERGRALYAASVLASLQGDLTAAERLVDEAGRLAEALDDDLLRARVAQATGTAAFCAGDVGRSQAAFEQAIAAYQTLEPTDSYPLGCYAHLASVHVYRLDAAAALTVAEEGLRLCEATGEEWCRAFLLLVRALARLIGGDFAAVATDARAGLATMARTHDLLGLAVALELLAMCAAAEGDATRTAELFGATDRLWSLLTPRLAAQYADLRALALEMAKQPFPGPELAAARRRGAALPLPDVIALATGVERY